jgi:hypothetical protein
MEWLPARLSTISPLTNRSGSSSSLQYMFTSHVTKVAASKAVGHLATHAPVMPAQQQQQQQQQQQLM